MSIFQINIALAPMRTSPSHKAEMCNELLYGEKVELLDHLNEWAEVSCIDYDYRGWILFDTLSPSQKDNTELRVLYSSSGIIEYDKEEIMILRGSQITNESIISGDFHPKNDEFCPDILNSTAKQYLNSAYRWGGRSPFGIDCSGFTQMVFMLCGKQLPRDASQQAKCGENIGFIQEAKCGDLAFFGTSDDEITHTGIIISPNKIIHASGRVKIETIDHEGIFQKEKTKYSHKLRLIKKII